MFSHLRRNVRFGARLAALLALPGLVGCTEDASDADFPAVDSQLDGTATDDPDNSGRDTGSDDARSGDVADGTAPTPVSIDLDDRIAPVPPGTSAARAYRVDDTTPIPEGPVTRTREGDFVLENDRIRLFVERFDESMSPCPYGGNIVDGVYKSAGGTTHGDLVGEVCPMLNVGLTLKPARFEILRDGSESGAAVVAVTGSVARLDFLNLRAMAPPNLRDALDEVPFDPGRVLPLTMTVYYILEHGDTSAEVVTAVRNDGDERVDALFGHFVKSGGSGAFFNPLNQLGGFGYRGIDVDNIDGNPLPYIGYRGEHASYAYMPAPEGRLSADLPTGGVQLATSGVAAGVLGIEGLASTLLATEEGFRENPGLLHLKPGQTETRVHRFFLGDGGLSTVVDPIYERMPLETGTINGVLRRADGESLEGARISAVDGEKRTLNQAVTDQGGLFSMDVPPGSYRLQILARGRKTTSESRIEIRAGETKGRQFRIDPPGTLAVDVDDPDGDAVPARVSVRCVDSCNERPTSRLADVTSDSLPSGFQSVEPTRTDGTARLDLPPGTYRVYVSRGIEWSVWPADAPSTGGRNVEIVAGETTSLEAEIARVVDTSGAIGGDYHVHGVRSADSTVPRTERVMNFVSEGVEVIVSTDHDVVTDYRPVIERLDVGDRIVGIRGDEITTSEIGHFNGFPLPYDANHRGGGALDWGRGPDLNMPPSEIYSWVRSFPGPQVVQVNHPASETLGLVTSLKADVLHGTTHADSSEFRLPGGDPDPQTGDTGYWSDDFTALELMNGAGFGEFWAIARWWMTMIGRGFHPTGTAVTDTHTLYGHLGGSPRTYVFGAEEVSTVESFDRDAYVEALNAGRAVGTNGPFVRVAARNGDGDDAGLGSTISAPGGTVTLQVEIDMPVWMQVDRVDIFSNLEEVVTEPGEVVTSPLDPTKSVPIEWESGDTRVAASGERAHRHRSKSMKIPLSVEEDAYVIVVVRGDEDRRGGVWPVVPRKWVVPFAFSNPIFVDADGGGYNHPPLAEEAASPPMRAMSLPRPEGESSEGAGDLSREELERLMEGFRRTTPRTHR